MMVPELLPRSDQNEITRRHFIQGVAAAATVTCVAPNLLGCRVSPSGNASTSAFADTMDEALQMMAGLAPLGNHGPMAAEALVALGRGEQVTAFVQAYKKRFRTDYPGARQPVTKENWREALGDGDRVADWTTFFGRELKESEWPKVLNKWSAILAPGLAAAAAHGLIRTGHATRSLSHRETDLRLRELAAGLGYWAAYYQRLPEVSESAAGKVRPARAINDVPVLPAEKRSRGSIMIALRSLADFQPFARVANSIDVTGNSEQFLSEVSETFATAYVRNVNPRNVITLIHTATSTAALRSLLPFLSAATGQIVLRYGWQTAAALYSISGDVSTNSVEAREIRPEDLIERAAVSKEEHAIKFTEACLREHARNPKPIYLQAAHDAIERLGRA